MDNKRYPRQIDVNFKITLFEENEFEKAKEEIESESESTFAIQEIDLGEDRLIAVMGRTNITLDDS